MLHHDFWWLDVRRRCRRKLQFLDLSAAFGEFRSDFGLPPSLSSLIALTELRIKVRMPLMAEGPAARLAVKLHRVEAWTISSI